MINKKMQGFGENSSVIRELFEYGKKRKAEIGEDKVFDFSIGNPSVPCPECITQSILNIVKENEPTALHGYTSAQGDIGVRTNIANYMNEKYGIGCEFSDIYMTVGAAASLTITLRAVANEGEEVIIFAPFFPEYKVFVENSGATAKILTVNTKDFQVDIEAFEAAVTEKTAAVIVNSPNNPTGAILTADTLSKMAAVLNKKQAELGKEIYLISDEPYRELVYDNKECPLPISFYDNTVICYSYSKSLSLPGERIGYILVSPKAPSKKALYAAVCGAGRSLGFVCAPSLWQRVIGENQGVTSDTSVYAQNRKLLLEALTSYGFEAVNPDGAFYLFLKSPSGDANEFSQKAKKQELLIVPSDSFGMAGYVRISYCVSREQIEASLTAFEALAKEYGL